MLYPPDIVDKGIMFSNWSSSAFVYPFCSFISLHRSCYDNISWTPWAISM